MDEGTSPSEYVTSPAEDGGVGEASAGGRREAPAQFPEKEVSAKKTGRKELPVRVTCQLELIELRYKKAQNQRIHDQPSQHFIL